MGLKVCEFPNGRLIPETQNFPALQGLEVCRGLYPDSKDGSHTTLIYVRLVLDFNGIRAVFQSSSYMLNCSRTSTPSSMISTSSTVQ
jgi:hypothetical protein